MTRRGKSATSLLLRAMHLQIAVTQLPSCHLVHAMIRNSYIRRYLDGQFVKTHHERKTLNRS